MHSDTSEPETSVACGFRESEFAPAESNRDDFHDRVLLGQKRMKTRRVVLAGLTRNIGDRVERLRQRVERTASHFADFRVVLFENDSGDDTADRLRAWAGSDRRVHLLQQTFGDPVHPQARDLQRVSRMAHYRDQYHRFIAANFSDFEHVIVFDTDLAGGWSDAGIADSFGQASPWDVIGANGIIYKRHRWHWNRYVQYDAWALRRRGSDTPLSTREANRLTWRRGEPLVAVNSCFGGLAIYRTEAFLAGRYAGGDCEHVTLHRDLRAHGYKECFLNPSQIVVYGRKRRTHDAAVAFAQSLLSRCGFKFEPVRFAGGS